MVLKIQDCNYLWQRQVGNGSLKASIELLTVFLLISVMVI